MQLRVHRPYRLVVRSGIALAVAAASIALPATAAHAADGTGWSGRWEYTAANTIEVDVNVPGAHVAAAGFDIGGTHNLGGQLDVSGSSSACGRVVFQADNRDLANVTACGGQSISFGTGNYTGELSVFLFGPAINNHGTVVVERMPSSINDSGLRTTGTAFTWDYYAPTGVEFTLQRDGAKFSGFVGDNSNGTRVGVGTLFDQSPSGCTYAEFDGGKNGGAAQRCHNGDTASIVNTNLSGYVPIEVCNPVKCLDDLLPIAV
jgi:hypothetical protein